MHTNLNILVYRYKQIILSLFDKNIYHKFYIYYSFFMITYKYFKIINLSNYIFFKYLSIYLCEINYKFYKKNTKHFFK